MMFSRLLRRCLQPVEWACGHIFGDAWNPWYQLGALSFFFYWIAAVSGLYLYIFFDTSIFGAYQSVERITHDQWVVGGVMRSLHRYASDAMVISVTLHLLREFSLGRFRHVRWFSWCTGVPLLWLLFASAIGGYWLVWDELAQYIAVVSSEWLDWLPVFGDPLARNFLNNDILSDRFFSLLSFLHIAIPLFLLLGMFIHIKRISKANSNPAKGLAVGSLSALLVLSAIKPALSSAPADLSVMPAEIQLDWIILNIYPVVDQWGYGPAWGLLFAFTLMLLILPWLPAKAQGVQLTPVQVDPDNCNGCTWCMQDCPYEAIEMRAHDFKPGLRQAAVDADACTACGICIGSCPSATPFRSVDELLTGIDFHGLTLDTVLNDINSKVDALRKTGRILLIGCDCAAPLSRLQQDDLAVVSLKCAAQLPPSFIDYYLQEKHIDGIFITGCGGDCFYRKGAEWVEQRLNAQRRPHLRASVDRRRVKLSWAGPLESNRLQTELNAFRQSLVAISEDES
jgi:ferredoxin/coenzyme F420-reducing hydrogenase delta subunit